MKYLIVCLGLFAVLTGCAATTTPSNEKQQAEVHYKMSVVHMQANNPTLALKELLAAVSYDPENSKIHAALSQAYKQKKAYVQAERHYLKALELSDNDPRYQNNLAALYLDMERWDDAIVYFGKAADSLLFVDAHKAAAGKGYAYFKKQDYGAALAAYDEAIELSPRFAEGHFFKSRVYQQQMNMDMVEIELRRAIELKPKFLQAHYELGMLLLDAGQLPEAVAELELTVNFAETSDWGVKAKRALKTLQ
jgi:Tfp pilus assembly protein PilF